MDFTLNEEQQIFREELCKKLVPWGYVGAGAEAMGVERDATIACIQSEELARAFPALVGIAGMTVWPGLQRRNVPYRGCRDARIRATPWRIAASATGAKARRRFGRERRSKAKARPGTK